MMVLQMNFRQELRPVGIVATSDTYLVFLLQAGTQI